VSRVIEHVGLALPDSSPASVSRVIESEAPAAAPASHRDSEPLRVGMPSSSPAADTRTVQPDSSAAVAVAIEDMPLPPSAAKSDMENPPSQ